MLYSHDHPPISTSNHQLIDTGTLHIPPLVEHLHDSIDPARLPPSYSHHGIRGGGRKKILRNPITYQDTDVITTTLPTRNTLNIGSLPLHDDPLTSNIEVQRIRFLTTPHVAAIKPKDDNPHSLTKQYRDLISLNNASTCIRFYGLNIHGISADNNYAEGQHLMEALKLLQVDVFGLQDLDLNTRCPKITYSIAAIFKSNNVGIKIQMSTSPELSPSRYKLGDTLTGLNRKLVGQVNSQGSDPVGRWIWITLQGENKQKVTIIAAYRVCPGNLKSTDGTVRRQELRALLSLSNDTPKPRKHVLFYFKFFILYRQQHNASIILFIDANDHLPTSPFQRFR